MISAARLSARWTRTLSIFLSTTALLSMTASVTACSSKGKSDGASTSKKKDKDTSSTSTAKADGTSGDSGKSSKPDAPASGSGKDLKATVWNASLKYSLGAVVYDTTAQKLTIDADIENELSNNQTPYPNVWLEADGAVISHGGLVETKEIIGKQHVKAKLGFDVEKFDAAKTTLVMGGADSEQVRVPMTGAGPNRTLEPVPQAFTGDIKIGDATFTVKSVEVRWDQVPEGATEAPKDKAFVVLVGDFKNNYDHELYIGQDKFVLTQPDGTKDTPEVMGPDGHVSPTKRIEKFYVVFKVDAKGGKPSGTYTLDVSQDWGPDGASVSATQVKLELK